MLPKGGSELSPLLSIDGPGLVGNSNFEFLERFRRLASPGEQDRKVEADDGCVRELGRERPEPAERPNGRSLPERPHRGRGPRYRDVPCELRCRDELPVRRHAAPELPERE